MFSFSFFEIVFFFKKKTVASAWHIRCLIEEGNLDELKEFLHKNPAWLKTYNTHGYTPFLEAAFQKQTNITDFLLAAYPQVINDMTESGLNVLRFVSKIAEVEKMLAKKPTLLDHIDSAGNTLLHQVW